MNLKSNRNDFSIPSLNVTNLSIVVITLNESDRIGKILGDLSEQTIQNFEVIVVDSNSEDETCEIARRYSARLPQLRVHNMMARGVCLGRNTGAELANNEHLLFLDADVRLPTDFLEKAMSIIHNQKLKVAGVFLNARDGESSKNGNDNDDEAERLPLFYRLGYSVFNIGMFATQFLFPTAVGACIFSTKTVHKKLNGFDASITLCEDCDYVSRASKLTKFRMLPMSFDFDARRLQQDGCINTARKYLYANIHRLFLGEIRNNKIKYEFGHYKSPETSEEST